MTVPFSAKRMVDEDECLDILDQMRVAIPEEIRQARRVTQDKERILAQAKEEGERVVMLAKEQAARLTGQEAILHAAEERVAQIQAQAEADAQNIRNGADLYAQQILADLQKRLDDMTARLATLQQQVNNGLAMLNDHQEPSQYIPPPPPRTQEQI